MKRVQARSAAIAGLVSVIVGLCVAAYFTASDWRLNPGGIFRSETGTDWGVVLQTALSWFLPVALLVFLLVAALHYWLSPSTGHR